MMVPWWYIPASWFVLIGVAATLLVIAAGIANYKQRKRSQELHKPMQNPVKGLKLYSTDERDPR